MNDIAFDDIKIPVTESVRLEFHADGTYTLKVTGEAMDLNSLPTNEAYLLQCYSNGCVNKVSINDLLLLRHDFQYSHGVYPRAKLMVLFVVKDEDYLEVAYKRNATERIVKIAIKDVNTHSILGLKGKFIIGSAYDEVISWRCGNSSFDTQTKSDSIKDDNQDVASKTSLETPLNLSPIIKKDKFEALYLLVENFDKNGRHTPLGQSYAKEILENCHSCEEFWLVIKSLLECNTNIYRTPIIEFFKEHLDSIFIPNNKTLTFVSELLFSCPAKPEKNLEFLYPFKDVLTDKIKSVLIDKIRGTLSSPEQFYKLGEVMKYSNKELIEYCLGVVNPGSFYCIYELLMKLCKYGEVSTVNKVIQSINISSIEGDLVKRLVSCKLGKSKIKDAEVLEVQSVGFQAFSIICASHKGKQKNKAIQSTIASYVGKNVEGKLVATYSNHYFLMISNGIRVLLPKDMARKIPQKGEVVNMTIAFSDNSRNTLYATQKFPIDYRTIMRTPLLNKGEVIEISFDRNGLPTPHNVYTKISVALEGKFGNIDFKRRYKAQVVRQTIDRYCYSVKILG